MICMYVGMWEGMGGGERGGLVTDRRRDGEGERAHERERVCTYWWEGDRQAAQVGHIPAELGNCNESLCRKYLREGSRYVPR